MFPRVTQTWQRICATKNNKHVCGYYRQEKEDRGRIKMLMSMKLISERILKLDFGPQTIIWEYLNNHWIASLSWCAFHNMNCISMKLFKTRSCTIPCLLNISWGNYKTIDYLLLCVSLSVCVGGVFLFCSALFYFFLVLKISFFLYKILMNIASSPSISSSFSPISFPF